MNLNRPLVSLVGLVAALSLLGAACGSSSGDDVATVGEAALSEDDLDAILVGNGFGDAAIVDATEARRLIGEWIFFESWIGKAAAGGTTINDAHLAGSRSDLEQAALSDPAVPDPDSRYGEIVLRYQMVPHVVADHLIALNEVEVLCSSHLLVGTEAEAENAIERYNAGEDFGALAMELSTGPSGPAGGDLGCVIPQTFVPEFVVGAAAVGGAGISAPTQSDFGWHVILVRSFDTPTRGVHPELASNEITDLVLGAFDVELRTLQGELYDRDISVDPRYGVWDETTGQVIAATEAG